MNVSSTNLFHFTSRIEWLVGILNNGFYPRYCLEEYYLNFETIKRAYPMVCFCDIPLSLISNHVNKYGSFGLGLTKKWANNKGLNPILYLNKDSTFKSILDGLSSHYKKLEEFIPAKEADDMILKEQIAILNHRNSYMGMQVELAEVLLKMQRFIKPYSNKTTVFYNEREWRFCPDNRNIVLKHSEYSNKEILEKNNQILSSQPLKFNKEDIKYVFVPNSTSIDKLLEQIIDKNLRENVKHKILNLEVMQDI